MELLRLVGLIDTSSLPQIGVNSDGPIKIILQIVLAVMGAVAVLIIALGGLRYTISRGDPNATARAKDTIIYAAIGLVVVVSAFTIVTFVVKQL